MLAGVGFIALAGIAVLNGLVMVTFITSIRSTTDTLRDAHRCAGPHSTSPNDLLC